MTARCRYALMNALFNPRRSVKWIIALAHILLLDYHDYHLWICLDDSLVSICLGEWKMPPSERTCDPINQDNHHLWYDWHEQTVWSSSFPNIYTISYMWHALKHFILLNLSFNLKSFSSHMNGWVDQSMGIEIIPTCVMEMLVLWNSCSNNCSCLDISGNPIRLKNFQF